MKSIVTSIAAGTLLAATVIAASPQPPRYTVHDLGPLGAPVAPPESITSNGLIAGAAAIQPGGPTHSVLWYHGRKTEIGSPGLGGPNNVAFGVNDRGQAVGQAQTSA